MPIFEYECEDCGEVFESIEVWSSHVATHCKKCGSPNITKLISASIYRDNPDSIKKSLPDPVPPLRELIGKNRPGYEGGYEELKGDYRELKDYTKRKDKYGNTEWIPKEKLHIDLGKKPTKVRKKTSEPKTEPSKPKPLPKSNIGRSTRVK